MKKLSFVLFSTAAVLLLSQPAKAQVAPLYYPTEPVSIYYTPAYMQNYNNQKQGTAAQGQRAAETNPTLDDDWQKRDYY